MTNPSKPFGHGIVANWRNCTSIMIGLIFPNPAAAVKIGNSSAKSALTSTGIRLNGSIDRMGSYTRIDSDLTIAFFPLLENLFIMFKKLRVATASADMGLLAVCLNSRACVERRN